MAEATANEAEVRSSSWSAARILRVLILLALLGGALAYGAGTLRAVWGSEATDSAFVEAHLVYVSPHVAGQVVEVLVSENQGVRAGEPLVRIAAADYEARLAYAEQDLQRIGTRLHQTALTASAAAEPLPPECQQAPIAASCLVSSAENC